MSPTLHSSASQIAVRVEKRTALAWLFLSTERLTMETPHTLGELGKCHAAVGEHLVELADDVVSLM
jgi:hypothetical protein